VYPLELANNRPNLREIAVFAAEKAVFAACRQRLKQNRVVVQKKYLIVSERVRDGDAVACEVGETCKPRDPSQQQPSGRV
jgi:hypothetical protein